MPLQRPIQQWKAMAVRSCLHLPTWLPRLAGFWPAARRNKGPLRYLEIHRNIRLHLRRVRWRALRRSRLVVRPRMNEGVSWPKPRAHRDLRLPALGAAIRFFT